MAYLDQLQVYDPQTGRINRVTPRGASAVAEYKRIAGPQFNNDTTTDATFWTVNNSGAGSAASLSGGYYTLTSGTANSGYGTLNTANKGRYITGISNYFHSNVLLTTVAVAGTTRSWGAFNFGTIPAIQDGFYFSVNAAGTLSVNAIDAGGTPVSVSSGSFNGQGGTTYTLDTNFHTYEIIYNQPIVLFFIDNVLIHTLKATNALLTSTLSLTAAAVCQNSASGTASASMQIWEMTIIRMGDAESTIRYVHINSNTTTVCKRGAGRLHFLTINSQGSTTNTITMYNGTDNTGDVIGVISFPSGVGPVTLIYENNFSNGLTIVTAGGTAPDMTVLLE